MKPIVELPNFGSNLNHIEEFWNLCQVPRNYLQLLDAIANDLYSKIGTFPHIGRRFLNSANETLQIQKRVRRLLEQAKATLNGIEIREYLLDDYLVLYGVDADRVYLIAIKHHKQAGFYISI